MKKKVKTDVWKFPVKVNLIYAPGSENEAYIITEGFNYWTTSSEFGRSKGNVECPCCGTITEIYIWSFSGGGKKCSGCNVLLGTGGAFIEKSKLIGVILSDKYLIKSE